MFILCGVNNIWMKWKYMCSINCGILKSKVLFILEKKIAAIRSFFKNVHYSMYLSSFINKTEVLIWQTMWLHFLRFSSLNSVSWLNTFSSYFLKGCSGIRYRRVKAHAIFVSIYSTITWKIIPIYFLFFLLDNPVLQQIDCSASPCHFSIKFKILLQYKVRKWSFSGKGDNQRSTY